MKKTLEKMITISLGVVSTIFVVFLLVLIKRPDTAEGANTPVVHALFIIFASIFAALTIFNILLSFNDSERVKQVLLFKTKNGAKKASLSVIRKLAKQTVKAVNGVNICHIHLFLDDNNDIVFKAAVKIKSIESGGNQAFNAALILEKVNAALELIFLEVLGLSFKEIELKLISAKTTRSPDSALVDKKADAAMKSLEAQRAKLIEAAKARTGKTNESPVEPVPNVTNEDAAESDQVGTDKLISKPLADHPKKDSLAPEFEESLQVQIPANDEINTIELE
ncbi:MAG: hypothetical protein FWC82_02800 [Firmicutes bacterium]|nr:hypothetical protein [Bacillota bacterium]